MKLFELPITQVAACIAAGCLVSGGALASGTGFSVQADGLSAEIAQHRQADKSGNYRDPIVSVILKYDLPSLASYEGGIAGLAATSPAVTGRRLDPGSRHSRAYLEHLGKERDRVANAARMLAPSARIGHDLSVVVGGVAVQAPLSEVERLSEIPGVKVYRDELRSLDTFRSPEFIGATSAWAQVGGAGNAGEGVIVGILDSGIWPEGGSFADPDPSGKSYAPPPSSWQGTTCHFGAPGGPPDAPFSCNNKLIGAARFTATYEAITGLMPYESRSARDDDGHGTHTASTAAGNANVAATVIGNDLGTISGIAPRAHIAAYKVCGELGCYTSDSAAAIQQAILDGVDVLNYSISGGTSPYSDAVSLAFLDAHNAGVFVAASAGNNGPGANTVGHRAPWLTTVAATTHDGSYRNEVSLFGNGALNLSGASITGGVPAPTPIVANTGDPLCLSPAAPGSFTGQIVVCERGIIARVDKSANVGAGGAVGLVLYNTANGQSLDLDSHSIPTSHIDYPSGLQLLAFLEQNAGATATISDFAPATVQGDDVAGFSSRGGSALALGVLKPDLGAPGVAILAGYTGQAYGEATDTFAFVSGTSMASPHIAGAAALLRQQRPDWTPGEIKSALMTTATSLVRREDGVTPATPFDTGAGRVDLAAATDPGITFSATGSDFLQFQGNLSAVNQPSIYLPANPGIVTVYRTARSTLRTSKNWRFSVSSDPSISVITPSSITLRGGSAVSFPVTIDASALPVGQVAQARLTMRTADGSHEATLPIAVVRRAGGMVIAKTCSDTSTPLGGTLDCDVNLANTGIVPGTVSVRDVLPKQLVLTSLSGPAGTRRVNSREFRFQGTLEGGAREVFAIGPGASPGGGYLPLSSFGISPIGGMGDETIVTFNVPSFVYNGQTWSQLGVVSNGYLVVGGGNSGDVSFINQEFPDPARPNNVLAPFWTDLNLAAGGAVRIGTLTDGTNSWIVVDWNDARNYSDAGVNNFQVWIGYNGVEDITFAYGPVTGGDGGWLTVGAESFDGIAGANYYFDGTGTAPANGAQLRVSTTPGTPGEALSISFSAEAVQLGDWINCAELQSPTLLGTATGCALGTVTPAP